MCPGLSVDNGMVMYSPSGPLFENTVATYTCTTATYALVGDATRTCQANGMWSSTAPTCASKQSTSLDWLVTLIMLKKFDQLVQLFLTVACPDITYPNGMIVYNPSTTPRLEGTTATHTCNTGYSPAPGETMNVRRCQSNGEWTITDRVCVGTLLQ